jgi:hypothetical protein
LVFGKFDGSIEEIEILFGTFVVTATFIGDGMLGLKVMGASEIVIGCLDPKIEVLLSLGTFVVDPSVGDDVIELRMMVGAKVVVIGASVIGAFVVKAIVGDGVIGLRVGDKVVIVIGASVTGDIVFTSSTSSIVGDGDGFAVAVLCGVVSVGGMDVVAESLGLAEGLSVEVSSMGLAVGEIVDTIIVSCVFVFSVDVSSSSSSAATGVVKDDFMCVASS